VSEAPSVRERGEDKKWTDSGAESGERRSLRWEVRAGGEVKAYLDLGGGGLIGEIARGPAGDEVGGGAVDAAKQGRLRESKK
jgi:hypothetical protein